MTNSATLLREDEFPDLEITASTASLDFEMQSQDMPAIRSPLFRARPILVFVRPPQNPGEGRWSKPYWQKTPLLTAATKVVAPHEYETDDDELGMSEETVTEGSRLSQFSVPSPNEPSTMRGVFAPFRKRKVLFTLSVEIETSAIKRRKPFIRLEGPQSNRDDD